MGLISSARYEGSWLKFIVTGPSSSVAVVVSILKHFNFQTVFVIFILLIILILFGGFPRPRWHIGDFLLLTPKVNCRV